MWRSNVTNMEQNLLPLVTGIILWDLNGLLGMKEVHYLDKLEDKKAIFKDGHTQEVDAIILCSGYLHHFPFLEKSLTLETHNRLYPPKLYKGVVWQDNHKLFYLGMQDQFHTFNMFDCQAWFVQRCYIEQNSDPK